MAFTFEHKCVFLRIGKAHPGLPHYIANKELNTASYHTVLGVIACKDLTSFKHIAQVYGRAYFKRCSLNLQPNEQRYYLRPILETNNQVLLLNEAVQCRATRLLFIATQ